METEKRDIFIGETFFKKYKIMKKIGQGSFGSIYQAISIYSNRLYAIKIEDMKQDNYNLEEESLLLSFLNFSRVPKIKCFGYSGSFIILVMELLGKSLDKIFRDLPSRKMTIRCVCNIAYQLILILEIIHNCDIIHRDIKPANIAIGREKKEKFIYLLDFGLSKKFRSSKTKKHFPFIKNKKLIGNARYSSINALEGGTQSRRDDLESLGYLLIYLLLGKLPWQGFISFSNDDKYYKIKEIKKSYTPEKLCEGLPPQFKEYISYTRNLHYEQDPDYNYLKRLFLTVLKNYNYEFDYYYDWKYLKITKKENKDKDKDNKSINFHRINYLDEKHKTSDLCNKISSLISQRKSIRGVFDYDRFVCDIDEESKINIQKMKLGYQTETINYFDDPNSIIPLPSHKKVVNHNGCLPCTSSSFNDKDNSCCIIY